MFLHGSSSSIRLQIFHYRKAYVTIFWLPFICYLIYTNNRFHLFYYDSTEERIPCWRSVHHLHDALVVSIYHSTCTFVYTINLIFGSLPLLSPISQYNTYNDHQWKCCVRRKQASPLQHPSHAPQNK